MRRVTYQSTRIFRPSEFEVLDSMSSLAEGSVATVILFVERFERVDGSADCAVTNGVNGDLQSSCIGFLCDGFDGFWFPN